MAAIDNQILRSIADVNAETLGNAPTMAVAYVYQMMAQSIGLAAQNATVAQQQGITLGSAVISKGSQQILAIPVPETPSKGESPSK